MNPLEQLGLTSVDDDLVRLEVLLTESVIFGDAYLDAVTTHLIDAGGKRLRALLAIASATSGERPATHEDLLGAVSLELMHVASLYHDDVMDEAEIRRNVDSVNARYGNLIAIVAGDYLMARTLAWLTRGQVSEVRTAFSLDRTEHDYFEAIEGKTAALMSSSCRMGAMTAHLSSVETEALAEFGRCFGMVYQLRDDILDLTATDNQLGKPAGQDLAEGIYSLPTLYALRDSRQAGELSSLLGRPLEDDDRERARKLVVATDGIDRTMLAANRFLADAHRAIAVLPSAKLRVGFTALITSLLEELPRY